MEGIMAKALKKRKTAITTGKKKHTKENKWKKSGTGGSGCSSC
jgi:hypothetical protein